MIGEREDGFLPRCNEGADSDVDFMLLPAIGMMLACEMATGGDKEVKMGLMGEKKWAPTVVQVWLRCGNSSL